VDPPAFSLPVRFAVGAFSTPTDLLQSGRDPSLICGADARLLDEQGIVGDFANRHSRFSLV
jgi:hypothetical protein